MAKSDYAEELALKYILTNASVTRPTARYIALFSDDPGEGATGTEVSGGDYLRKAETFTFGSGQITNDNQVLWTNMPSVTVTHIGIFDADTSGNMLYYGPLDSTVALELGDTFKISAAGITVTEA